MPQVAPEQPAPETFQVTAVFRLPMMVAKNGCCAFSATRERAGVTLIASGGIIVTDAEDDFVVSTVEVAVIVTSGDAGTEAGAV